MFKNKFTYASLFCGLGGFDKALNELGMTCVFASEIDKYASKAYEILYGHKPHGDITKIKASDIPDHDLLCGGFPCQAFSVAGKRKGFEDTRGTLFFEIERIAKEKKPKILFLENVKGLLSHDKGRTLDIMITSLNNIGYTIDFNIVNSKYFDVPQNRERIIIIAIRNDLITPDDWEIKKANNVLLKAKKRIQGLGIKTFNFKWPEQNKVNQVLRDILEIKVDEKYYLPQEKVNKLLAELEEKDKVPGTVGHHPSKKQEFKGYNSEICPCLIATDYKAPKTVLELNAQQKICVEYSRKSGIEKELDTALCLSASDWRGLNRNQKQNAVIEVKCEKEHTNDVLAVLTPDRITKKQNGRRFKAHNEPMFTLTSQDIHGLAIRKNIIWRIRKLTPLECFRLQGFSDDMFHKLGRKDAVTGKQIISNSQLYKMIGNAVTVNVIDAIANNLLPYLKGEVQEKETKDRYMQMSFFD